MKGTVTVWHPLHVRMMCVYFAVVLIARLLCFLMEVNYTDNCFQVSVFGPGSIPLVAATSQPDFQPSLLACWQDYGLCVGPAVFSSHDTLNYSTGPTNTVWVFYLRNNSKLYSYVAIICNSQAAVCVVLF